LSSKNKENENKLKTFFKNSAILRLFDRFAAFLYKKASVSVAGHILLTDNEERRKEDKFKFSNLLNAFSVKEKIRIVGRSISRTIEKSFFLNIMRDFTSGLVCTKMKVYGWFLMSFGFYSLITHALKIFGLNGEKDYFSLYSCAAILIMAIPFLSSNATLIQAMRNNRITHFLLTRAIGIRESRFDKNNDVRGRSNVTFILGIIFGIFTYWISPLYILGALGAVSILYLILVIPEFGVLLTFFILPFAPTMLLALMIAYITVCYLLKLIQGKRSITIRYIDVFIIIFMLLLYFGGIVSVSSSTSIKPALLFICMMLGYFLTANLINTPDLLKRVTVSLVSSAVIVSLYGLFQNFFGTVSSAWQDTDMFSSIAGRVVSTFDNPNVLAEYLIKILPFAAALLFTSDNAKERFSNLLAAVFMGLCLIFTWSRGGWLGFMIGIFIFLIFMTRKTLILVFFGLLSLPFLPYVLPQNIVLRLTSIGNMSDGSTSYRVHIWDAVVKMLGDCFSGGIGIGEGAFAEVYPLYSFAGIEAAPHSHNLFFQITVEIGIIGLIVFIIAMLLLIKNSISFAAKTFDAREKLLTYAGMCGILSILAQGMTDYVWYNYRIFLMFWLIVGLTTAYRRTGLAFDSGKSSFQNDPSTAQIDI